MTNTTIGPQRPLEPQPKAIIVGASSGLGAALVQELARQGYHVAALARREEALQAVCDQANKAAGAARAFAYPHNVTDYEAVPVLFAQITQELGGLDLIIYVAGIQPTIGPDEYDFEKDAAMVGVNLLGALAWLNVAAERFSQTGKGQIPPL